MSYENIDDYGRRVVVRKDHNCEWCPDKILKGETAVKRVYKLDGDFASTYMHPECFEAMTESCSVSDNPHDYEFPFRDNKRGEPERE